MRRRDFIAALAGAAASPLAARAQFPPAVGFLSSRSAAESAPLVAAFRGGLGDAGFVEGGSVAIEYRWADNRYDRLAAMAADLVERGVAVIVAAGGPPSAFAAKAATKTVPIVFTSVGNPVEIGLVSSLGRPGGNVTGSDFTLTAEIDAKRLQLLHETIPSLTTIGMLVNPKRPDIANEVKEIGAAAARLGLRLAILEAGTESEIDDAVARLARERIGGLLIAADPFFSSRRDQLVGLAARFAVPAIYQWRDFVVAGGLMSYGASLADAYRQAGMYAGRILKGQKAADLPIARPTKFELVLNINTAKTLGLSIPPSILARADEVIE